MMHCTSIACTTIPYYHYIIRNASAMHTFGKAYRAHMCTFMDAFDIMTTLSASFPESVRRTLSQDYIHSSISFFKNMPLKCPCMKYKTGFALSKETSIPVSPYVRNKVHIIFAHILVLKNSIVSQSSDSSAARISPACKPSYEIRPSCSIPESIPTKESLHIIFS